ncbi:peptide chain release factor N(5)-glutamine methyltransferase [Salinibacter sp. 10B]|uniref:peptide chain release factor N(5)-glutamine methyltransferase n=1 Tax=Salinibacter sp. 10B TaxID=1923971 RepID=UPI0021579968|nr:peptide chain release factor N(5)-glutamine methyltransferase [Salinibacter sp. 10B]
MAQSELPNDSRQALLEWAQQRLRAAEQDAPRRTAEWVLIDVLGIDRGQLYARARTPVAPDAAQEFRTMVERCLEGEPLQHVLGYTSFRGLRIDVSPAVMIPRPETEEVVEAALRAVSSVEAPQVLDVGTGSGCIALALKHERPDAQVEGWDVSAEALAVARRNADRLDMDVHFAEVDLFAAQVGDQLARPVDLLISNPPYIPNEEAQTLPAVVREYDPPEALFSGEDPLRFYRTLATCASVVCAPGAAIVLETHADYAEEAAAVLREAGLAKVCVETDLSDRPRILTARYRGPTERE